MTHPRPTRRRSNVGGHYWLPRGPPTIDEGAFTPARADVSFPRTPGRSTLRRVEKGGIVSCRSPTLPDGFESMDNTAFWYMPKLERVDLGGMTVAVSDSAFRYDKVLTGGTSARPGACHGVEDYAVRGCADRPSGRAFPTCDERRQSSSSPAILPGPEFTWAWA